MLLPILALIFLAVFCASCAAGLLLVERSFSPRTELKRRLQQMSGTAGDFPVELRDLVRRNADRAGEFLTRLPHGRRLEKRLQRAAIALPPALLLAAGGAAALCLAVLAALRTRSIPFGVLAGAALPLAMELFLRAKISQRTAQFTEQFPDALNMIARSLRAGHSFPTAVQLVGEELPPPLGALFKTAYEQQQLGLRMIDALSAMNDRIDSMDLRFFTTLVAVNADIGGNLSELLDRLALTIRERLRIRRQVQVYTAQGRLSGYVLGALPVIAFAIFNFVSPDYERTLLREPMGLTILALAALLQLAGLLAIGKIIRIRI